LGGRLLTRAAVCVINLRAQTFLGTGLLGTRQLAMPVGLTVIAGLILVVLAAA
jgi:hypothetical protein